MGGKKRAAEALPEVEASDDWPTKERARVAATKIQTLYRGFEARADYGPAIARLTRTVRERVRLRKELERKNARIQTLEMARDAHTPSPEKKEERCFADSDPETRKVVYKALTTMAKYVVKPAPQPATGEKVQELAAFYQEDVEQLMYALKAVDQLGVDPDEWVKVVKQTLAGKPLPPRWVAKTLELFESKLRKTHDDYLRGTRRSITDQVTDALAAIIRKKPQFIRDTYQAAADVALAIWIIVRKGEATRAYSEACEDRDLLEHKLWRLKVAEGTTEILVEMASEFMAASVGEATWALFREKIVYYRPYLDVRGKVPLSPKKEALAWMRSYVNKANEDKLKSSEARPSLGGRYVDHLQKEADAAAGRSAAQKCGGMPELWRDLQKEIGVDDLTDAPNEPAFCMERAIPITDRILEGLEGSNAYEKLQNWTYHLYLKMPKNVLQSIKWNSSQVTAMFCLMLTTDSFYYNELGTLITWLLTADEAVVRDFLVVRVLKKKRDSAALGRTIEIYAKLDLWVKEAAQIAADFESADAESAAKDTPCESGSGSGSDSDTDTASSDSDAGGKAKKSGDDDDVRFAFDVPIHKRELSDAGNDHYDYDIVRATTSSASAWFLKCRERNPRPAHIRNAGDWKGALWFEPDENESAREGFNFATLDVRKLSERCTMKDQILKMELGGAWYWLERQYHPLADWEAHVQMLIRREMFERYETARRPNVTTITYNANLGRLKECIRCFECNDPAGFLGNANVFTEDVFKNEYEFESASATRTLSGTLGEFLLSVCSEASERPSTSAAFSGFEARGWPRNMSAGEAAGHTDLMMWLSVITFLAELNDHVGVVVVDAMSCGLANALGDVAYDLIFKYILLSPADFTEHTAPLMLAEFWQTEPSKRCAMKLQAAARKRCYNKPRLRFPNSPFTAALTRTSATIRLWAEAYRINLRWEEGDYKRDSKLCKVTKETLEDCHCRTWRMGELVWGGCALIRYAELVRLRYSDAVDERPLLEDVSAERTRANTEIAANLEMAEVLLAGALEAATVQGITGSYVIASGNETSRARKFLREARELRTKWHQADTKRNQQQGAVIRNRAQAAKAAQRKVEEEQKREVDQFVSKVFATVRANLNAEWAEAEAKRKWEAQQLEQEQRREAERLAKEAKRQAAERKAALKRVIETNREVAARREAHLAKRAVIEKKAAEREKREAAERAKERERKQWEEERAKHKAEEEERAARAQREVEAEQRARERRRAEEEARATAAALAAERERVANVERARREKEEEEQAVRQREEADLKRALAESEAARVRDEPAADAYYRDGVPQAAELERRADQSRFDRMVMPKVDAFREAKKRTALGKAFGSWRVVAERKREAKRDCARVSLEMATEELQRNPKLEQEILEMRQVLQTAQATIDRDEAGPSMRRAELAERAEAERQKAIKDRLMQQRVDRMYNKNRALHKHTVLVKAMRLWRIAAEHKREWNGQRSRTALEEFTYQRRCDRRTQDILRHWLAEGTPQGGQAEATIDRDMLAKAAIDYFRAKKGDRWAVAEDLTRKTHYWYNKCCMSKAIHSWRDAARAAKAKKGGKKLAEARRATQEHCNAIFRENMKQREEAAAAAMPAPPPPPPPAPLEPAAAKRPVEAIESVTTHAQWKRDYQKELLRVQADSKMQWDTGTGWAAGAHTLWLAFGGQDYVNARVRERQQWDVQCATFWANSMHMNRVRQKQREAVDDANRRELKEAAETYLARLEDKKAEHGIAMHSQMEAWKRALQAEQASHEAKQRAAEADFQAKLDTITTQNASLDSFEAENRTLVRERANLFCGRLRARLRAHEPNAVTSRLAQKHECVVCLDATCTHVATACGHVIGCNACCSSLTACPICCAETTFVEMRFPH